MIGEKNLSLLRVDGVVKIVNPAKAGAQIPEAPINRAIDTV